MKIPVLIDAKAPSCLSQEADVQLECSGQACAAEYGVYEFVKRSKDRFEIIVQTDDKEHHGTMSFSLIARDESFGLVTISPRLNIEVSLNNPCFEQKVFLKPLFEPTNLTMQEPYLYEGQSFTQMKSGGVDYDILSGLRQFEFGLTLKVPNCQV